MSYPQPPEIATSYTAVEQALGNGSLPGQEFDVDLAAVRASITAIIEFLKTSIRSDGRLNNGSVSSDTLASSLILGFDAPAPWMTATAYTTSSTVFEGYGFYLCLVAHTSGTFATDLASGRWVLLADLTPPGGALIDANNLSDVPDKPTARSNLGLGSMATTNSGTGAAQFRTNLQNEAFFQPLMANLTAIGALASAADKIAYFTGAGTAALTDLSAFALTLLDDVNAATARTTLGAQASDQDLTDIAAVTRTRGAILRGGSSAWEGLALGAAGRHLISDGTDLVYSPAFAYTDVTGSRAVNTNYTNTGNRPILVLVNISYTAANTNTTLTVDGVGLSTFFLGNGLSGLSITHSVIVPAGGVYQLTRSAGNTSISSWREAPL